MVEIIFDEVVVDDDDDEDSVMVETVVMVQLDDEIQMHDHIADDSDEKVEILDYGEKVETVVDDDMHELMHTHEHDEIDDADIFDEIDENDEVLDS